MTDEAKKTLQVKMAESGTNNGKNKKSIKVFLIASASVLVVALVVAAFVLMGNTNVSQNRIERVIEYGTVLKGVSVGGVDISGMTEQEALDATAQIPIDLVKEAKINLDIDGEIVRVLPVYLGMHTDYDEIIANAIGYGHSGSFEERKEAADTARAEGVAFEVDVYVDEEKAKKKIADIKAEMDTEPQEAGYVFTPWGHFEDGTPFEPDADELEVMYKAIAGRDEYVLPEGLQRIAEEDMPNEWRYQYYNDSYFYYKKYDKHYIPKDASIQRFYYTEQLKGIVIDGIATLQLIMEAVQNDDFSTIKVPVTVTEAQGNNEETLYNTQLIASWTSSHRGHHTSSRTYNVAKMSSIVCGQKIMPGEEWSINEAAGPRTGKTGWKEAGGISGGAFTSQDGGGVCQISSTLYNAAIRAGLDIVDKTNHSIISTYIPLGLDATISTGKPDLVLKNPYDVPVYIVSYLDGEEQHVTVEIYGPPVMVNGQPVILDFSNGDKSKGSKPTPIYHYNATVTPAGDKIPAGKSVEYVQSRPRTTVKVYKHILDLEGNQIGDKEFLETVTYRAYTGQIYVNNVDPDAPVVTPTPSADSPTVSPTTSETPKESPTTSETPEESSTADPT